jgi:chitin-binding protein
VRTKVALAIGVAGLVFLVAAGAWAAGRSRGAPAAGPARTTAPALPPPTSCVASISLSDVGPGSVQATVTIRNTGTATMHDWYVQWTMPLDTTLTQGWNATLMKSGTTGMVHAPESNADLAPGAIAIAKFLGTGSTTPTFTDVTCG